MRTQMTRCTCVLLALVASLTLARGAAAQTVEYYHTDAIGSVRVVTDAAGNLLRQHDYWPFGAEVNPPPGECTDVRDPRGFTGQERDKETCQDYFGGRYYRSGTVAGATPRASGRFTSPDPVLNIEAAIVDPQRWNRYSYVRNGPLVLVDPDGRDPVTVGAAIGAAVYGGWAIGANVASGRPWYQGVGVEASRGLIVGASLGLLAPAAGLPMAAPSSSAAVAVAGASSRASTQVVESVIVRFGGNANQTSHAFRHVEAAGRDVRAVAHAISTQLQASGRSLAIGETARFTVTVEGTVFKFNAHRLSAEVINVGRITPG